MSDKVTIANPVKIMSDSPQRVALELMLHISAWENTSEDQKRDKKYWLGLYCQCLKATGGHHLESILQAE